MGKWGTGKLLRKCERCDKEFYSRRDRLGKYCSKSCVSKKPGKSFKLKMICSVCSNEFTVKRYRKYSALYCSVECRRKRMPSKENHPRWKGGINRTWESKVLIKKLIKMRNKCELCGSIEKLQGHHIVPYSVDESLRSCENNIQILCIKCHANKHPDIEKFILKGIINE